MLIVQVPPHQRCSRILPWFFLIIVRGIRWLCHLFLQVFLDVEIIGHSWCCFMRASVWWKQRVGGVVHIHYNCAVMYVRTLDTYGTVNALRACCRPANYCTKYHYELMQLLHLNDMFGENTSANAIPTATSNALISRSPMLYFIHDTALSVESLLISFGSHLTSRVWIN